MNISKELGKRTDAYKENSLSGGFPVIGMQNLRPINYGNSTWVLRRLPSSYKLPDADTIALLKYALHWKLLYQILHVSREEEPTTLTDFIALLCREDAELRSVAPG